MTDNVVHLSVPTVLDIPPSRVLQAAIDAGLTEVVLIGYDQDGKEYIASSVGKSPDILWLLEIGKFRLLADAPTQVCSLDMNGRVLPFPSVRDDDPKEPA